MQCSVPSRWIKVEHQLRYSCEPSIKIFLPFYAAYNVKVGYPGAASADKHNVKDFGYVDSF